MAKKMWRIDCASIEQEEMSPLKRVAAYCRISTKKEEQQTSLDNQMRSFRHTIARNEDWKLVDIYADEGITGTSAAKRLQFVRMIEDCEAGKIDLILTKSISRFARNTLECLTYVRQLQSIGVHVIFEEDNINTGAAFSEMIMTILAAFAQEESRSLSENLKWGIRKRFEEGIDRWVRIFGYHSDEFGKYQIVPEEAEIVREVFDLYEKGMSMPRIGKEMMARGRLTPLGNTYWDGALVKSFLENEKYIGDIVLQKLYTQDHLSHRACKNDQGAVPSYYIQNHHAPIISRKTFERVSTIRQLRGGPGKKVQYPFGSMLHCPCCGNALVRHKLYVQEVGSGFFCEQGDDACYGFVLRTKYVERAVLQAYAKVNMQQLRHMQAKASGQALTEIQAFIQMKEENEAFSTVEYYWLDELVCKITITEELKVLVKWRCGMTTTVQIQIARSQDDPQYMADRQNDFLQKREALSILQTRKEG